MTQLDIKPLSVNEAFRGKRYKTPNCHKFDDMVDILLKKCILPKMQPKEPFYIIYIFHTSVAQDYDNNIKCFQDRLMKRLNTDDRYIYGAYIKKVVCKKKQEKIEFGIYKKKKLFLEAINRCEAS